MNIVKSELIKTFSVRSTWVYLALIVFGMASFAVLYAYYSSATVFSINDISGGGDLVLLILIFAVANIIGADTARKTIAWTYLATNRRCWHLAAQTLIVVLAAVLAGVVGLAIGALGVFVVGSSIDWGASLEFAGYSWALSSLLRWAFYGVLAALLTRVLGSGVFAAMILLAEIFVIGAFAGVGDGFFGAVAALMPLPNTQILVHGADIVGGIEHGRGFAALDLAVLLVASGVGALWAAKRKAVG